jgi:hypothetical protein
MLSNREGRECGGSKSPDVEHGRIPGDHKKAQFMIGDTATIQST